LVDSRFRSAALFAKVAIDRAPVAAVYLRSGWIS
jgi:hypothetical protein